jgi:hypothetical protein
MIALGPAATAADWKNDLKTNIESTFTLCKLDRGGLSPDLNSISRPGTPLVIKVDGIDGDIASNISVPVTLIESGQTRAATGGISGLLRNEKNTRTLKVGQRVLLVPSVRSQRPPAIP